MNKRADVAERIGALLDLIDDDPALDDISALLAAVGAACMDKRIAEALIDAINPIMVAAYHQYSGRNN